MSRHIVIIQGHPDASKEHYGHALATAYARAASHAGHEVNILTIAKLDFPLIRRYEEFYQQPPPATIQHCQDMIRKADHLVLIYPLWLGGMPAILKGFIEQVFRPGFAMEFTKGGMRWKKLLTGKSARIVITMGMPAFVYSCIFGAHSLKSLEKSILKFSGIRPIRRSLIGTVEGSAHHRERWLKKMAKLGEAGI